MYLDHAKVLFEQLSIAEPDEVRPCTDAEVTQLEQHLGQSLPAAYREFLLWMGHGAGRFFVGTDYFYPDIKNLERYKESAQELLEENSISTQLPEDAFIFYMHQGYQIMYLRLAEGDDPPVYYYGEGEGYDTIRTLYSCYSKCLETAIEGHARSRQEIKARQAEKQRKA